MTLRKVRREVTGILRIWEPDPLSPLTVVLFDPASHLADRRGFVHRMRTGERVTVVIEEEEEAPQDTEVAS